MVQTDYLPGDNASSFAERYSLSNSTDLWLWSLVAVGFVLDIASTYYGLGVGLEESNPIIRRMFSIIGVLETMVFMKSFVVAMALFAWVTLPEQYRPVIPIGVSIPWLIASAINLSLILRV